MEFPFEFYGYKTNSPPRLTTAWNEEKRVVDLSRKSYVFATILNSIPWRERQQFPNANRSEYGKTRTKRSLHWLPKTSTRMGVTGAVVSSVFWGWGSREIRNFIV